MEADGSSNNNNGGSNSCSSSKGSKGSADNGLESFQSLFSLGSLGSLGAGFFAGAYYVMRKENAKYSFRSNPMPMLTAARALLVGTALCCGTFALGTGAVMVCTNTYSFADFDTKMKALLAEQKALDAMRSRSTPAEDKDAISQLYAELGVDEDDDEDEEEEEEEEEGEGQDQKQPK